MSPAVCLPSFTSAQGVRHPLRVSSHHFAVLDGKFHSIDRAFNRRDCLVNPALQSRPGRRRDDLANSLNNIPILEAVASAIPVASRLAASLSTCISGPGISTDAYNRNNQRDFGWAGKRKAEPERLPAKSKSERMKRVVRDGDCVRLHMSHAIREAFLSIDQREHLWGLLSMNSFISCELSILHLSK